MDTFREDLVFLNDQIIDMIVHFEGMLQLEIQKFGDDYRCKRILEALHDSNWHTISLRDELESGRHTVAVAEAAQTISFGGTVLSSGPIYSTGTVWP